MKKNLGLIHFENHAFKIDSEVDLVNTFGEREQRRVILPDTTYPIRARYYYAWKESSGVYTYLVFRKPEWKTPRGLLFKRSRGRADNSRMCDWCLSVGTSDQVGMLGLDLNTRQSIGIILCTDLGCINRLQDAAILGGKDFDKLAQQLLDKIGKLYDRFNTSGEHELLS
jgi:hypothetical protein